MSCTNQHYGFGDGGCPYCGRCPTCGRGGYTVYPGYPNYPFYPQLYWQIFSTSNTDRPDFAGMKNNVKEIANDLSDRPDNQV